MSRLRESGGSDGKDIKLVAGCRGKHVICLETNARRLVCQDWLEFSFCQGYAGKCGFRFKLVGYPFYLLGAH